MRHFKYLFSIQQPALEKKKKRELSHNINICRFNIVNKINLLSVLNLLRRHSDLMHHLPKEIIVLVVFERRK